MRAPRRSSPSVCVVSVTIPACEPVSEIASWPRSRIAIAHERVRDALADRDRACRTRADAAAARPRARARQLVGGVAHRREDARRRDAGLACGDEPAGDLLDLLGVADRRAAELHHDRASAARRRASACDSRNGLVPGGRHAISRRPVSARPSVTSSAYSRSPPTGRPLASRVTRTVRAAGRRGTRRSPRRSCSGWSRARPPSRRFARPAAAARRCADAPARRRRAARVRRRGRGRGRETRSSARPRSRSTGCSTTQISVWSRRASRQIAQRSSSVRFPHSSQKRTRSLTSWIAAARRAPRPSAAGGDGTRAAAPSAIPRRAGARAGRRGFPRLG